MGVREGVANSAWLLGCLPAWSAFRRALEGTRRVQRDLLLTYLKRNAGTLYADRYRFRTLSSVREYQQRVPPVDYEEIRDLIGRMARGEPHVLTSEPVTRFVPTSGSTSAVKLIPYTKSLRAEFARGIMPWIFDLFHQRPDLLGGPGYWSVSPPLQAPTETECGIPIGFEDDAAYLGFSRRWVARTLAVPPEVSLIRDPDRFRYTTLLFLLRAQDLRLVSVWNPSFFTVLLKALVALWERLIADIRSGNCSVQDPGKGSLPPREHLPPLPARAEALTKVEPHDFERIWPRLRLISCWTAAHAKEPAIELQGLLPRAEIQGKGLIATEAFVTLPFEGLDLLAVRSHFFEFEDERGRCYLADELEIGRRYTILLTTGGGLYRYRLHDEVEVTAYRGATPALRFLGRTGVFSDLRGEKISEGFAGDVIAHVASQLPVPPTFALLAPDSSWVPPGYSLYLELECPPTPGLVSHLEQKLCENPYYSECVRLGQLSPSRIYLAAAGAREKFFNELMRMGLNIGGVKPSPLSPHTHWSNVFSGTYLQREGDPP